MSSGRPTLKFPSFVRSCRVCNRKVDPAARKGIHLLSLKECRSQGRHDAGSGGHVEEATMREESKQPRAKTSELVVKKVGEELLVYDLARHKAHSLNRVAAAVWRACDG